MKRALVVTVVGGACWLADRIMCQQVQAVQLHAWWHVLTAIALHEAFSIAAALHLSRDDQRVRKVSIDRLQLFLLVGVFVFV